jgi:hypothetical protein
LAGKSGFGMAKAIEYKQELVKALPVIDRIAALLAGQ